MMGLHQRPQFEVMCYIRAWHGVLGKYIGISVSMKVIEHVRIRTALLGATGQDVVNDSRNPR